MKEQLHKLQMLEQNLQMLLAQKHALQSQILSAQTALKELSGETVYQFVGNLLLEKKTADVKSELEEKLTKMEARMKSFETQEKSFTDTKKQIEAEVLANG